MQNFGIHLDFPFLRMARIEKQGHRIDVSQVKTLSHLETEEVKQFYISSPKGKIISGLPAKNLMIRPIDLKVSKDRHTDEIIAFQSEATSYFDPSEVLSVPYYYSKAKGKIEGLLFTAHKPAIRRHLEDLKKFGFDPDLLTAVPLALIRYIRWKFPTIQDAIIIELGSSDWTCISMEKGRLHKSHSIPGGVESLLSALWEDRKKILLLKELEGFAKQIDLLQLKAHLNPHLYAKLSELRMELGKIVFSFCRSGETRPLYFTGRIDSFSHLPQFLIENLKDTSCELTLAPTTEHQKYAVSIGLGMEYSDNSLQLQRGEFFSKKNWIRSGKYLSILMLTSLFLSTAFIWIAHHSETSRKKQLVESLKIILGDRDPILRESIFQSENDEEEILNRWNETIVSHLKKDDLSTKPPKVAEVLSWLLNHPVIQKAQSENDPIEITRFRYRLDSFPRIDAPKTPFKTKVEIEFRFKNPMNARKFHESVLMEDQNIDSESEINWEALRDSYRASFYLKRQNR